MSAETDRARGAVGRIKWNPPSDKKYTQGDTAQVRWWEKKDKEAADSVSFVLETLRNNQSNRFRQLCLSAMLYGNQPVWQMYGVNQIRLVRSPTTPLGRLTYNATQAAIDTLVSDLCSDENVPYFLTKGGDFRQQKLAQDLTKFSDGILYENKIQAELSDYQRDACVLADAICVGYLDENGRVKLERALAAEFYIDEIEGQYGKPRSVVRVRSCDKELLVSMFPDKAAMIRDCQRIPVDGVNMTIQVADAVDVRESWHLPTREDKSDGCHMITIQNGMLFKEPWAEDWLPMARLTWCKPVAGYWGISAVQQIMGMQLELNKLLWIQSRALHLAGAFKAWVPIGSAVVKEHMDNQIGTSTYYSGPNPPQYVTVPAVSDQVIQRIAQLKQDCLEQLGCNMLSTTGQKPAGLDSGEALREYADQQTKRFYSNGRRLQEFVKDVSLLGIRLAKMSAKQNGGHYTVRFPSRNPGSKFLHDIDWAEVNVDETDFVQRCWSVALLPDSPAGNMQSIAEQVQAGWLTPRQGKKLSQYPDLASAEQLDNAAENYLQKILDKMLYGKGEPADDYTPPTGEENLQLAAELVAEYIELAKTNDAPEERIQLLRNFAQDLHDQTMLASMPDPTAPVAGAGAGVDATAGAPPPGGGAVPQGQPAQAPVSPLMPQRA